MAGIDQHKKTLENTLNSLMDVREGSDLEKIVKQSRLDIFRTIGDTLFIDQESITDLESIGERVKPGGIEKEINDSIAALPAAPTKSDKRDSFNALKAKITGHLGTRNTEFNNADAIIDTAKKFKTNINNTDIAMSGGTTVDLEDPTTNKDSEDLEIKFTTGPVAGSAFELYDENATKLKKDTLGRYILTLPTKTGGTKNVAVEGMSFVSPILRFNNTKLLEPDTSNDIKDEIDLSKDIKLPIGCILSVGGKKIAHLKTLKFKLKDTTAPVPLTDADQRNRYDIFNMGGIPINRYIQDFYDNNYKESENKLLDEMIGDTISEENKKVLRDRIKNLTVNSSKISPFIVNQLQINNNFKEYFFKNVKPAAEDISTPAKYNDFLKKNIPEQLKIYLEKELKRQMESTSGSPVGAIAPFLPATRELHNVITREILLYKQEQEKRSQDTFDDSKNMTTDIEDKKIRKRRSPKLTRAGLIDVFGKKDASYVRFFAKQSMDIGKQSVKLQTDEKKNKVEFQGYEAKVNIGSTDHIEIEIKLDNGEEVTLGAGNHIKLIKSVLNEPRIPYGKMRMHIAYNIMKSLIKIAKKNNITVEYASGKIINSLSIDKNDDIILEKVNDTTGVREKTKAFSEKDFDAENDMHQLRAGLENCLGRFNKAMNLLHKQYKQATDKRLFEYFSISTAKFPTSRFRSPIKKLMNIRKNRTLNFDFEDTKVEGISENVSISFKKNKFTITSDLLEKPISSKNLGKLLRKRVKGKRIFDGIERAMSGMIYKKMIGKLRENSKIANTNFGVKDPIKNRVYFLDKMGKIGYISMANNKNPINRSLTKLWGKDYGTIKKMPSVGRVMLTKPEEQNEVYQNPLIMGKLMKAINTRLYSF